MEELQEVEALELDIEEKHVLLVAEIERLQNELEMLEMELKDMEEALAADEHCLKLEYKAIPEAPKTIADRRTPFSPNTLAKVGVQTAYSPHALESGVTPLEIMSNPWL